MLHFFILVKKITTDKTVEIKQPFICCVLVQGGPGSLKVNLVLADASNPSVCAVDLLCLYFFHGLFIIIC